MGRSDGILEIVLRGGGDSRNDDDGDDGGRRDDGDRRNDGDDGGRRDGDGSILSLVEGGDFCRTWLATSSSSSFSSG